MAASWASWACSVPGLAELSQLPWRSLLLVLMGLVASAILRVVLSRKRRGSVVWVLAVLAIVASCPAFVASPYRLSLEKGPELSDSADLAEQFKTASVAGAVAFLMNCGIQGVDADASLQSAYQSPATVEQHMSYERAPLRYGDVQQKLYMQDLDAALARSQADVRNVEALQAMRPEAAVAEVSKDMQTDSEGLAVLEQRIAEEKLRLSEAQEHLKSLEDDLQAAKVRKAMQEAASLSETSAGPEEPSQGLRDVLLIGFGAIMGAAGYALACLDLKLPAPAPAPALATSGALGLAFTASVYTSAPALSAAPVHLNTSHRALPLLSLREASSPSSSSSPLWGSPFLAR